MMHENQNDQQFDILNKGQNEEGSQNLEDTNSEPRTQSDRTEAADYDYPSNDEDKTLVKVGKHSERHPLIMEEYERSRLQAAAKNNVFFLMSEEDERQEANDPGIDEGNADDDDDDDEDDDEDHPRDFDDELLELGDSPYPGK